MIDNQLPADNKITSTNASGGFGKFIAYVICLIIYFNSMTGGVVKAQSASEYQGLKVGILPDTQGAGSTVSIHPMEAVLQKLSDLDVDIVIPVGDLTNHGSAFEFEQWTTVAKKYQEKGIEFLPLMGNHETSFAYTVEWMDSMKEFIPTDAIHMSGAQYQNYYVLRENVLIVLLRYYNLPIAFQWIKDVVDAHSGDVDHIVIASHDGLIGAKYGETREMIVEGIKGQNLLLDQWDEIRSFFAKHDVIWVQGHEHMYQRSVIKAPIHINPSSWKPSQRNYRLPQYTQIISGNASYKGYEFRYGEREKVQAVLQHKMNTMKNGSRAFDVNASILRFKDTRVDFESYFTTHTIKSNEEGKKELTNPEWILFDRFSRTNDRCEKIVYPNSIPEDTRPVLTHDVSYRTNSCYAEDGSSAIILHGINNTFNRVESTARTLSWEAGFSRAQSQKDLARLAYQYLFQYNEPWSPNLNGHKRLVLATDKSEIEIPPTTIDLKEHLTLSWSPATSETLSDILIVSGTQVQSGTYQNAYGMAKDIEKDGGVEGSQPDGSAKQPHDLPEHATKSWDVNQAVADSYVLQFKNNKIDPDSSKLAYFENGNWIPFASEDCVINEPFSKQLIENLSAILTKVHCLRKPIAGVDTSGDSWWVVLNSDAEIALIGNKN